MDDSLMLSYDCFFADRQKILTNEISNFIFFPPNICWIIARAKEEVNMRRDQTEMKILYAKPLKTKNTSTKVDWRKI